MQIFDSTRVNCVTPIPYEKYTHLLLSINTMVIPIIDWPQTIWQIPQVACILSLHGH